MNFKLQRSKFKACFYSQIMHPTNLKYNKERSK
nr:MAG TPA: hypothetical protein [Caudoviricetes sp.]